MFFSFSQNPDGFDEMVTEMAENAVPIIKYNKVNKLTEKGKSIVFLDARELKEFKISHIKNAIHVGYDNFDNKTVSSLNKNAIIVIYCSVGYRSGKIGLKLRKMGFTNVFNLYGGLFEWANNGNPIYQKDKKTNKVHPYNTKWGKWLKPELRSK